MKKNRVKIIDPVTGERVFASEETAKRLAADIEAAEAETGDEKTLADMTKVELVEYAAANSIEIDEKANKADLLADIEAAEAKTGDE